MDLLVVTAVKNDLRGLLETHKSILDQSIDPHWVIVTPFDFSETHRACLEFLKLGQVNRLIQDDGHGVYSAMNKAIFESEGGDWIWFLNAGDEFAARNSYEILKSKIAKIESRWLYGGHFLGSESRKILGEFKSPRAFKISNQLFARKYISHQATIFQVGFLQELNGFDLRYRIAADWDLMCRASKVELPGRVNIPLCIFYMGGLSTKSRQKSNIELLQIRSIYLPKKYLIKSYYWFSYRFLRNFFVQSIEEKFPELTNFIRKVRIRAKR